MSKGSAPVTSGKQLRFTDRRRTRPECGMSLSPCPVVRRTRCPRSVSGWMRVSLATMRLARRVSSATQLDICQIACIFRWCWCNRCCRSCISPTLSLKRAKTQTQNKSQRGCGWAYPTLRCSTAVTYVIECRLMLFPSTQLNSTHLFAHGLRWNVLNYWILNVDTWRDLHKQYNIHWLYRDWDMTIHLRHRCHTVTKMQIRYLAGDLQIYFIICIKCMINRFWSVCGSNTSTSPLTLTQKVCTPVNGNHVGKDDDPRLPHSRQAHWFSCLHNVYSLTTLKRCRVQAHWANWWLWWSTCCWCLHRCNLA